MCRLLPRFAPVFWLGPVLIYSGAAAPQESGSTFKSTDYHFAVQCPAGWYRNPADPRFYIENFPPSKAIRAVRLPMDGGAAILVLTAEQVLRIHAAPPTSLSDWVAIATKNSPGPEKRKLEIEGASGPLSAVEVKSECCAVAPFQETIDWYFEIDGHFFDASVTYWQGNAGAEKLREVLQQVVRTLKVIPDADRN